MCHGIPRGQLLLRDEIAEALLDGAEERDTAAAYETAADAEANAETLSHLTEEAAEADVLTGAMSTDDPFENDGSSPR